MLFSQKTIFYTINGRFINTAFNNIDYDAATYHAAISFGNGESSVLANFGAKSFKFGVEDMLSNHYKDIYQEIWKENIESKKIFDLVHDYLLHSGFVGTLHAFEDESSFALMRHERDEFIDKINDKNATFIPSSFNLQRRTTLGPDAIPLSTRSGKIPELTLTEKDQSSNRYFSNDLNIAKIGQSGSKKRDIKRRRKEMDEI